MFMQNYNNQLLFCCKSINYTNSNDRPYQDQGAQGQTEQKEVE